MKNVKDIIIGNYNYLNKQERKVAEEVLRSPEKIIHNSIKEAALACGVSDTTVFRFCSKLGFDGFQDFKIHLAMAIPGNREEKVLPIEKGDDTYVVMNKILASTQKAMKQTIHHTSTESLEQIAAIIEQKQKILIYATSASSEIAGEMKRRFSRLGYTIECTDDPYDMVLYTTVSKNKAIAFFISDHGTNPDLLEQMELAKRYKIPTVVMTRNKASVMAIRSDFTILCEGFREEFMVESLEMKYSALLVMDILYFKIFMKNEKENSERLQEILENNLRKER
ncbi:MAG: MurR/RpiR family transcriptional regulator [Tissierellia bacterium]|nr:MurR/RpiR family transcriptional regulator [Tissierellia bacterium]